MTDRCGSELACDDDGAGYLFGPSMREYDLTAGQAYMLIVDGWASSDSGDFTLEIYESGCPVPSGGIDTGFWG